MDDSLIWVDDELEEVDVALFQRLRAEIFRGAYRGNDFNDLLSAYCGSVADEGPGYDLLDVFVNHLCSFLPMPELYMELEPELVYYQKTPVRVVLELIRRVSWSAEDVFVDLGAGLGQVAMLVHLLTGVVADSIEIDPALCAYAQACALELGLSRVSFSAADARTADLSRGTVFFLYTPFTGTVLDTVLGRLRQESLSRKITVVAYGPCTTQVAVHMNDSSIVYLALQ